MKGFKQIVVTDNWKNASLTHCCRETLKGVHRQTVQTQISYWSVALLNAVSVQINPL